MTLGSGQQTGDKRETPMKAMERKKKTEMAHNRE